MFHNFLRASVVKSSNSFMISHLGKGYSGASYLLASGKSFVNTRYYSERTNKMTKKLYLEQADLYTCKATVTFVDNDDKGNVTVQFDQTIFHPQGGGQPSDKGSINGVEIIKAEKVGDPHGDFEVSHVLPAEQATFKVGDEVELAIDGEFRYYLSRLHTAGHLISNAVQDLFGATYKKCMLYPGTNISLTFENTNNMALDEAKKEEMQQGIQAYWQQFIEQDPPITESTSADGKRQVHIGNLDPFPCAGTHTKTIKELGHLFLLGINRKKKEISIKFDVKDDAGDEATSAISASSDNTGIKPK